MLVIGWWWLVYGGCCLIMLVAFVSFTGCLLLWCCVCLICFITWFDCVVGLVTCRGFCDFGLFVVAMACLVCPSCRWLRVRCG